MKYSQISNCPCVVEQELSLKLLSHHSGIW